MAVCNGEFFGVRKKRFLAEAGFRSSDATDFAISSPARRFYSGRMSANVFRYQHRVAYAECTLGNHIYYARYLDLLEAARGGFFRHLGTTFLAWQERDTIFPVIECRLRYKAPARYDDLLTIEIRIAAAGRVRLNFAYWILNQTNTLILEAETFHVCAGRDEKPKRLPEALSSALQPYLHFADDRG